MKTVLVVEDNAEILDNIAELLSLSNYHVLTANDGKEGVESAIKNIPDIIISDITMPVLDGIGMLHILRRNTKTEHIPVVFLTSKNEHSDFRNAMQSGADDFLSKPFNTDELLKTIENRLKRADKLNILSSNSIDNTIDLLANVNTSDESLKVLTEGIDPVSYHKKQVIYKEGYTPHYLFYIQKGKVRTYKTHEDGKQLVINLYGEGDFFGHIALLEEAAYKETAEAMEESDLPLINRKDFEELVHKNVSVANKVIKMLAKNITMQEQHLLGIAYNTLRKKVAIALTILQNKFGTNGNTPYIIDSTREELAAMAGTAKESLIRTLSEFKDEQLIDIKKDNKIEITNPKKLANLIR